MHITMIGSGYVGLVSGACFADFGHTVVCVDKNVERVRLLNEGHMPIYEPGLDVLVSNNVSANRLSFTTDLPSAVSSADVVFIGVGTPPKKSDGHADLSYVYAAVEQVARSLSGFTVIVTKSTVPVGTGDEIERLVREINPAADFTVISNPEFLREGCAIEDFVHPDRVVIGADDDRAFDIMTEVYRPINLSQTEIMFTGRRTAELIKYASNAFLAMKVTFINEVANLCEKTGANVQEVSRGIGLDSRIGGKFLQAGPGFGGSCFPKDTIALAKAGQDHGSPLLLVEATIEINERRKIEMGNKIIAALGGDVSGKTIGLLGLAFKPDTDDMRDAPSLGIIRVLQAAGAKIRAYDPESMDNARSIIDDIEYVTDEYEATANSDCVVLVTEWNSFKSLDLSRIKNSMRGSVFFDLRNVYSPKEFEDTGLNYISIGRPYSKNMVGRVSSSPQFSEAAE